MNEVIDATSPDPVYQTLTNAIQKQVPLSEITKLYTSYVLETVKGNRCHAAKVLGVDRRTVQRWIKGKRV